MHSSPTRHGYLRASLVRSESETTSTPPGRLSFLYAIRRIHYRGSNGRTWLSGASGSPCGPAVSAARSAFLRGLVEQRRVRKCFRCLHGRNGGHLVLPHFELRYISATAD